VSLQVRANQGGVLSWGLSWGARSQIQKIIKVSVELFFFAFLGMSAGKIIFDRNFKDELLLSRNNGCIDRTTNLATKALNLSWEKLERTIGSFMLGLFFVPDEDSPSAYIIQSGDGSEILHIDAKAENICLWGRDFTGLQGPGRILIPVFQHDAIHSNIRPISSIKSGFVDSIGLLGKAGIPNQSEERSECNSSTDCGNPIEPFGLIKLVLPILLFFGISLFFIGARLNSYGINHALLASTMSGWWLMVLGTMLVLGPIAMLLAHWLLLLGKDTVPRKYSLTSPNYRGTVIAIGRTNMANVLDKNKQVAIISALAEGSGIRQIERITGVHRDTIMRLGVRTGKGCARLLDRRMRDLPCRQLQFDELWGFIGKKERHVRPDDSPEVGDVWTFCAIDRDTKLVPSFKVGKRDLATADAFVADVASRMRNRIQISSDALGAYVQAIESNFGADVDFAQIVKTYITDDSHVPERRFSAPEIVVTEKKRVTGMPNMRLASTSHVERLNGTTRLHMRRLTRLTYAFSKKLENFDAAVALHFAYYNFVKRHNSIRCTPAMAAGIERDFWSVADLVEAAA